MKNPVNDDRPVFVSEWTRKDYDDDSIRPTMVPDEAWGLLTSPLLIDFWEFKFLKGGSFNAPDHRNHWNGMDFVLIERPHFIMPMGDGYSGPFFNAEKSGFRICRSKL